MPMQIGFGMGIGSGTAATPSYTYATWNPLDVNGARNSLSGGDLDVTNATAAWAGVRATTGHTATDEYYEGLYLSTVGGYVAFGACTSATAINLMDYPGIDATGVGVMSHGYSNNLGVLTADTPTFAVGDRVGVHIKRSTNQVVMYKIPSGSDVATLMKTFDISTLAGQALYPAAGIFSAAGRGNFGAITFANATPPAIGVRT